MYATKKDIHEQKCEISLSYTYPLSSAHEIHLGEQIRLENLMNTGY